MTYTNLVCKRVGNIKLLTLNDSRLRLSLLQVIKTPLSVGQTKGFFFIVPLSVQTNYRTMTIYNYKQTNNNLTKFINIACEIATREQFETDCHRLVPMDTKVIHLRAKAYKINLPESGRCDYDYVRSLLKLKGYGRAWCLQSVWLVEEEDQFYLLKLMTGEYAIAVLFKFDQNQASRTIKCRIGKDFQFDQ